MDFVPMGFSGSVFLEIGQQNILYAGFGLSQRDKKILFQPNTVFALGSLTEVFTAVAIMQLIDRNQLRLSNTLSMYFKDVPQDKSAITVQHLLQHRSGMATDQGEDFGKTSIDAAKRKIFRQKLATSPGAKTINSPSNYILLAMIVEKVSGEGFKSYCGEKIFQASGMTQTGYNDSKSWPQLIQAEGYGIKKRKSMNAGNWPEVSWGAKGSDGLISSTEDLSHFLKQLLHGNILSNRARDTMFSLGLGWNSSGNQVIFQIGTGSLGQGATIRYYPENNAQMIILTNSYSGENPPNFLRIARRLEKELLGID
jgi:CubicO group peptidase (beta-lactamase class C family)